MKKQGKGKVWKQMKFYLCGWKSSWPKISKTIIATTVAATGSAGAYNALAQPVKADTEMHQVGVALSQIEDFKFNEWWSPYLAQALKDGLVEISYSKVDNRMVAKVYPNKFVSEYEFLRLLVGTQYKNVKDVKGLYTLADKLGLPVSDYSKTAVNGFMTRGQAATILAKAATGKDMTVEQAINWFYNIGFKNASEEEKTVENFAPNDKLTLVEAVGLVYKLKEKGYKKLISKADVNEQVLADKETFLNSMVSLFSAPKAYAAVNDVTVTVDGEVVYFPDQKPTIESGRTLIPVRAVTEAMGIQVDYDATTREVTFTKGSDVVKLTVDSKVTYKNGVRLSDLDVPAKVVNGRTYVPLRFIAEAFGANVEWINADRLVKITMEGLSNDSGSGSGGTGGTGGTGEYTEPIEIPEIPVVQTQNPTFNVPTIEEMEKALEPIAMAGGYTDKNITTNDITFSLADDSDFFNYAVGGGGVQLIFPDTPTGHQALAVFLEKTNINMTPKLKAAFDAKSEKNIYVTENSPTLLVGYVSEDMLKEIQEKYNMNYHKYPYYGISFSLSDL